LGIGVFGLILRDSEESSVKMINIFKKPPPTRTNLCVLQWKQCSTFVRELRYCISAIAEKLPEGIRVDCTGKTTAQANDGNRLAWFDSLSAGFDCARVGACFHSTITICDVSSKHLNGWVFYGDSR